MIDSLEFGVSMSEAEWKRKFGTEDHYQIASVYVNRHIRAFLDENDAPALPAFHPEEIDGKSRLQEERENLVSQYESPNVRDAGRM